MKSVTEADAGEVAVGEHGRHLLPARLTHDDHFGSCDVFGVAIWLPWRQRVPRPRAAADRRQCHLVERGQAAMADGPAGFGPPGHGQDASGRSRHLVAATTHGKPPQSRRAAAPLPVRCPRWLPRRDSSCHANSPGNITRSAATAALRRASRRGGTVRGIVGIPGAAVRRDRLGSGKDEADGANGISAPVPDRVRRAALGMTGVTMAEFLSGEGIRLAYDTAGGGDPPIIFVHGWSCDRSYFAPQFEHFAVSHAVAAMDLRGHGDSSRPIRPGCYALTSCR